MTTPDKARRRARLALVGLAALFFVPLALSFYLYYGTGWRPAGGAQHGDLVDPPRPLPEVELALPGGGSTGPGFLRDVWTLVYFGDGACGPGCRESLVKARQVRLALDKDMGRVGRAFLFTGSLDDPGYFAREHTGLVVAGIDGAAGAALLQAFPVDPAPPAGGRLYLVDPLGNLLMSYPADAPPKALLEDLERLLRLSHIG